jgi:putative ABC transport system permease protein
MRVPLLRGRDIASSDRIDAAPVVVINEVMAKRYWPSDDPIGKRITLDDSTWATIVGIAKNTVQEDWSAPPQPEMFLPYAQQRAFLTSAASRYAYLTLVARIGCGDRKRCESAAMATPLVRAVREVNRRVSISSVQTMSNVVEQATAESRFYLVLLAVFAAIALTLAAVGIYGVMSYSVSRRTHEIGIRIALGAEQATVLRFIVRQGMSVALIGAGVGLVAAFALTRLMGRLLFGVGPTDPTTFALVTATLCTVALAASYLPARRATRVDPLTALRSD